MEVRALQAESRDEITRKVGEPWGILPQSQCRVFVGKWQR